MKDPIQTTRYQIPITKLCLNQMNIFLQNLPITLNVKESKSRKVIFMR